MPDWTTFAIAIVTLTALLLVLTQQSARALHQIGIDSETSPGDERANVQRIDDSRAGSASAGASGDESRASDISGGEFDGQHKSRSDSDLDPEHNSHERTLARDAEKVDTSNHRSASLTATHQPTATTDHQPTATTDHHPSISTDLLLANVVVSQALALAVLVAIAWWTAVPASAFGVHRADLAVPVLLGGLGAGVVLYAANEVAAGVGERFGVTAPERLRRAMAPDDARGWGMLLFVVLPVIAVFEEALFRGAFIGALAVGFDVSPWLLAVGSSIAFGLGHGAQGRLGIVVTGALGLMLAAIFITTGSLLLVIVAHYVINALEFISKEGFGWDPAAHIESRLG